MKRRDKNLKFIRGKWWTDYRVVIGRETDKMSGKAKNKYRRIREPFATRDEALEALDLV